MPDYSATDTSVVSYAIIPENPPFYLLKNRDMENQVWHQEDCPEGLPSGWGQNCEGVHDVRPQSYTAIWFWLRTQLQGQRAYIAQDLLNLLRNRFSYIYLLTHSRRQLCSSHQASFAIPILKGGMFLRFLRISYFYIGYGTSSPEFK